MDRLLLLVGLELLLPALLRKVLVCLVEPALRGLACGELSYFKVAVALTD